LFAVPFWWGLPSYNSWAFDEIEPEHLEPGRWPAKYPLVHRDLLGALYVPAGWLADRLELEGLYRASYLQAAARLLSVLLSLGTVALIYGCARELGGGESERDRRSCHLHGLFAAAIVATLPPFVFYAKTANLEAPYLFWLTLSLLFFLRLLRRQRWGDYLFFAVAAVLTIGTKDQAYGLYVASPLPILAALSRHHRASGTRRPWLRAMLDPKVWATGAVTFLGLALVHRVGIDPEWLPRHLEVITGSASQDYRAYPATLMGQWELARASGRHLSFCLGLPLLVAALAGLWRFRRGLALGLLALSYYLTFMVPIGYSYVRFFLPVCLLLALPAGRLLARLWCRRGRGYLGRWLVVAVLAHAGLRGVAVDLLMLRDARYPAERLLAAAEGHAVGLGPATLLPRLELVRWGQLRGRECRALAERDARYVVIHPVELIDPRIVARLKHGEMGYRLLARFRQQPLLGLLELDGVETNLAKIARDVQVYERDGPCFDVSDVYAVLSRIREGAPQASDRSEVARYLIRNPRIGIRRLGLGALAAGFSPDLWTYGADPALLVFGGGA
ncbi:MAG: glycosyltransferase family 39 protein, partial [Holophagales bacterium]|nr:glycosyltransferase family 39 protein [Holophagales bacterium]